MFLIKSKIYATLGQVALMTDVAGTVVTSYDYSPFGAVSINIPLGATAPTNPFQFSSEDYDPELGLVYYNYRHYSPLDGRFLSRDPIEEQGGFNLYAFVKNNVLRFVDAIGKSMVAPGAGGWYPRYPRWGEHPTETDEFLNVFLNAVRELLRAYESMKKANVKGSDKYFHCIGMCNAARKSNKQITVFLAKLKEVTDLLRKGFVNGFVVPIEKAKDSIEDMKANLVGINCNKSKTCEECCCHYKVKGLK